MKTLRLLSTLLLPLGTLACQSGFAPALPERDDALEFEDVLDEGDDRRVASNHLVDEGLGADDLGDRRNALDRYEMALTVDPGNPWAYMALARHELEGGDPARALSALDRCRSLLEAYQELTPEAETHLLGLRGGALQALGRGREAAPLLDEARRRAPNAWGDGMLEAGELR